MLGQHGNRAKSVPALRAIGDGDWRQCNMPDHDALEHRHQGDRQCTRTPQRIDDVLLGVTGVGRIAKRLDRDALDRRHVGLRFGPDRQCHKNHIRGRGKGCAFTMGRTATSSSRYEGSSKGSIIGRLHSKSRAD